MKTTIKTPPDSVPVGFTTDEIYKLAHYLGWIRHYDDGTPELEPISETSSFRCACGERVWLLDWNKLGQRARDKQRIICPHCGIEQANPFWADFLP